MSGTRFDRAAAAIAIAGFVVAGARMARFEGAAGSTPPAMPPTASDVVVADADGLAVISESIAENDPFRLSGTRADLRFEGTPASPTVPIALGVIPPALPRPKAPGPVLKAVLGGPPWQALLANGESGANTVVREGMVVDGLQVASIRRDTVVLQGKDTSYTLTLGAGIR